MASSSKLPEFSLLATLEGPDGKLDRKRFPVLASTLDKKYGAKDVYVVRWSPSERTVELSDGRKVGTATERG